MGQKFWNDKLVQENLDPDCFVLMLDYMSSFYLGPNLKSASSTTRKTRKNEKNKIVGLGCVIAYKNRETGKNERLFGYLLPETSDTSARNVMECVKQMLDDRQGTVLQEVVRTRSHMIVNVF